MSWVTCADVGRNLQIIRAENLANVGQNLPETGCKIVQIGRAETTKGRVQIDTRRCKIVQAAARLEADTPPHTTDLDRGLNAPPRPKTRRFPIFRRAWGFCFRFVGLSWDIVRHTISSPLGGAA